MGVSAKSSLQSARRKFIMNSTYIMSTKLASNVFWAQQAKMSLSAKSSLESAKRKFFMNSTYIMSRK